MYPEFDEGQNLHVHILCSSARESIQLHACFQNKKSNFKYFHLHSHLAEVKHFQTYECVKWFHPDEKYFTLDKAN